MAVDWLMRQNDRLPSITATLKGTDGAVADLTDATVKFQMSLANGGANKINAAATVVDAPTGQVRYDWASGDTDTVGSYEFTWQATFASGKPLTFPNATNGTLTIVADLAS